MSKSEFRLIQGHVVLRKEGASTASMTPLWLFGAMPFLFVKVEGRFTHLLPDNTLGNATGWRWDRMWVSDAYRLDPHVTVVSAIDIARETAKRITG